MIPSRRPWLLVALLAIFSVAILGALCLHWMFSRTPDAGGESPTALRSELEKCVYRLLDAHAQILGSERDPAVVNILGTELRDSDLACLSSCKHIMSLTLGVPTINGSCLQYFDNSAGLIEVLELSGASIERKEYLARIGAMKNLHDLSLSGAIVDDSFLDLLKNMSELRSLALHHTHVSDAGMKEIASHKRLEGLNLYETPVGDDGVEIISTLPNCRELGLGYTRLTDRGAEYIARMATLSELWLRGTQTSASGFAAIAKLPNLVILDVRETNVPKTMIENVRKARPKLTIIDE